MKILLTKAGWDVLSHGSELEMSSAHYSWRGAILKSGLPPTTRHVLLTLSCHMNDAGESCYPSIELLCEETGLSKRAVIMHLQNAADAGWIAVDKHGFKGKKWARNEYKISWPEEESDDIKVVHDVHHLIDEGGAFDDIKVVHDVHPSSSMNYPEVVTNVTTPSAPCKKSSPLKKPPEVQFIERRFVIDDDLYDRWVETYPEISLEGELAKAEAWLDANPKRMKSNLKSFLVNWLSRAQSDMVKYLKARQQQQPAGARR